jgi:bacteriorhodopsin
MPVVAQRQNPAVLAAAATNIQLNRALYSVVVPAFGLVLLVLALRKGFNSGKHSRSAYAFIASLAVLSGLAGSLGSHAKVEAIIQALLSLFRESNIQRI